MLRKKDAGPAKIPARAGNRVFECEPRIYVPQSFFPWAALEHAQRVATALMAHFPDQSASPPDIALALQLNQSNFVFQFIVGSAVAYGLTEGGWISKQIKLTPLGRNLATSEINGGDYTARMEAVLKPRIPKAFFEKFANTKFPDDETGIKTLIDMGIPYHYAGSALERLKENGRYAGIIHDTPDGAVVRLDAPRASFLAGTRFTRTAHTPQEPTGDESAEMEEQESTIAQTLDQSSEGVSVGSKIPNNKSNRIFITQGSSSDVFVQVQKLLLFGHYEPVVSVESASTAVPIPEKVFEDMRSCEIGIIHIYPAGIYFDDDGKEHMRIDENALIKVGAALALYGNNVILLMEQGVMLPEFLRTAHRCEYAADKLDYEATIKLIEDLRCISASTQRSPRHSPVAAR